MVKIYTMSDLHIDWNCMTIKDYEELFKDIEFNSYLIIAGDLCEIYHDEEFYSFFDFTTKIFKNIIYIAGNHEYYKSYLDDGIIRDKLKKYVNVTFLQNEFKEFEEDKFVVYGTTLWTGSSGNLEVDVMVSQHMNDYKLIYNKNPDITKPPFGTYKVNIKREDIISLHKDMYNKLEDFLEEIVNEKITKIVVTHHLPMYDLISDEYRGDIHNSGYASNLNDKLKKLDFDYWICGHTHKSKDYDFKLDNGKIAKFIVNPFGYAKENPDFNKNKSIDL